MWPSGEYSSAPPTSNRQDLAPPQQREWTEILAKQDNWNITSPTIYKYCHAYTIISYCTFKGIEKVRFLYLPVSGELVTFVPIYQKIITPLLQFSKIDWIIIRKVSGSVVPIVGDYRKIFAKYCK
jgi:hypothetical protein